MGNDAIWIEGEDIKKVEYTAQNGMMYNWADNNQDKTITLEGKTIYSNDKKVSWLPPNELITWMENENTTNKPVDFPQHRKILLRLPQLTLTEIQLRVS